MSPSPVEATPPTEEPKLSFGEIIEFKAPTACGTAATGFPVVITDATPFTTLPNAEVNLVATFALG